MAWQAGRRWALGTESDTGEALTWGRPVVGEGSSVALQGGFQWLGASLPCESRCGNRQEQGGKRLPVGALPYGVVVPIAPTEMYLDGCVLDEFADMRPSV